MTTKKIWRLKEQPSTVNLRELVQDGILTKEEAREILFSQESEEDRDKKSLESEVKFLRDLVEKLSKDRTQIITTIREIEVPYRRNPWYQQYQTWCLAANGSTSGNIVGGVATGGNLLSNGVSNAVYSYTQTQPEGFSKIKTF